MARPFIALEAAATSWVGRQGSGLLLPSGVDWEPSLQSTHCLDAYPPGSCSGYTESHHSSGSGLSPTLAVTIWLTWDPPQTFCRKPFEFLEAMSPESTVLSIRVRPASEMQSPGWPTQVQIFTEKMTAQLGVQESKSQKGTRMDSPLSGWEGLLAEHLPSLQEQGFKIDLYLQWEKKKSNSLVSAEDSPGEKMTVFSLDLISSVTRACLNKWPGRK